MTNNSGIPKTAIAVGGAIMALVVLFKIARPQTGKASVDELFWSADGIDWRQLGGATIGQGDVSLAASIIHNFPQVKNLTVGFDLATLGPESIAITLAPNTETLVSYTQNLPAGSYTLTVNVYDEFGNMLASKSATFSVSTSGPAPTVKNSSKIVQQDGSLQVAAPGVLSGATGTGLTAKLHASPVHGSLWLSDNGSYTYTPSQGYSGTDSFQFYAVDAYNQSSNIATVSITVTASVVPEPKAHIGNVLVQTSSGWQVLQGLQLTLTLPSTIQVKIPVVSDMTANTLNCTLKLSVTDPLSVTTTNQVQFSIGPGLSKDSIFSVDIGKEGNYSAHVILDGGLA